VRQSFACTHTQLREEGGREKTMECGGGGYRRRPPIVDSVGDRSQPPFPMTVAWREPTDRLLTAVQTYRGWVIQPLFSMAVYSPSHRGKRRSDPTAIWNYGGSSFRNFYFRYLFLENHEKNTKFNAARLIDWARNGRAALCGPISVDITLAHPKPPALLLQHWRLGL
jgi:hypothetical protein